MLPVVQVVAILRTCTAKLDYLLQVIYFVVAPT